MGSCALIGGCSGAAEWAGDIEERDGVVYVNNPASGLWSDREQPPLRFELEQVFGVELEPEAALLGQIGSVAGDAQGTLYVLDRQPWHLVSFAPDGAVNWTAGREGEGPGELNNPRGLVVDGDSLYVWKRSGSALDTWDAGGNFISRQSFAALALGFGNAIGILQPDVLVTQRALMGQTGVAVNLVRLGETPELIRQLEVNALPEQSMAPHFAMMIDARVRGTEIVLGGNKRYAFRVFDRDGNPTRVVTRDVDYLRGAGTYTTDQGYTMRAFGGVYSPVRLASGHWLGFVYWPSNVDDPDAAVALMSNDEFETEYVASLDMFDADGRFLYGLEYPGTSTPEIGRPLFVDADGKLYTQLADPFPQVRRYRVIIDE